MITKTQEPIQDEESLRLGLSKQTIRNKIVFRNNRGNCQSQKFVDVFRITVNNCLVPKIFSEELPQYFLDLGGSILILFGQWLFDPHTCMIPEGAFENWKCEESFFGSFSMRCLIDHGIVLKLKINNTHLIRAQRLDRIIRFKRLHEFELIPGSFETLFQDLHSSGLIE